MKKLKIDMETGDRITYLTLKDYRKYLKKELKLFETGEYLHPEDIVGNKKKIKALNLIIKDFGVAE